MTFSYPTRPNIKILDSINLKINARDKVIIYGQSGEGKSTIILLLLRFYDVDDGEILIDGINIKSFNVKWLRNQIGFVQQEALLFDDTVRNNICLNDENYNVNIKILFLKIDIFLRLIQFLFLLHR